MRLAILGTRGIPASYSGFETMAEELGARLVARGHEVTVYGRPRYVPPGRRAHRGVRIVTLPTISRKYLDTLVHTALATVHAMTARYDAILVCNAANAIFTVWPRLAGTRVALNVDGHDRHRRKWSAMGRLWYALSERLALVCPNAIVTDAEVIERYFLERYRRPTDRIAYGARAEVDPSQDLIERFGLEAGRYVLYVSRLEPENNAHEVVAGFGQFDSPFRLAVVGDAPYAGPYIAGLKASADPRVVFTGGVYGRGYRQLQTHAALYVQATEVGGTHPALIEAMAFGHAIVANDVPEHREVLGEAGVYFEAARPETLARALQRLADDPEEAARLGRLAAERAGQRYNWDQVTDAYEQLFARLCRSRRRRGRS